MLREKTICEYCDKEISKTNIKKHYLSKICKEKQKDLNIIDIKKEFNCKYCNTTFNRCDVKDKHEKNKSCNANDIIVMLEQEKKEKEKYIELLKEKDIKYIELLKQKNDEINYLKKLINKQSNINNTTVTNSGNTITNNIQQNNNYYININHPDDIMAVIDKLDKQCMSDGSKAFGVFLMEYVLKDKIFINDLSRKLMSYKLNGQIIKDDGFQLIPKMIQIFEEKTQEVLDDDNCRLFKTPEERQYVQDNNSNAFNALLAIKTKQDPKDTPFYKDVLEVLLQNGVKK